MSGNPPTTGASQDAWNATLHIARAIDDHRFDEPRFSVRLDDVGWRGVDLDGRTVSVLRSPEPAPDAGIVLRARADGGLQIERDGGDPAAAGLLARYLPVALSTRAARRARRPFVVAHLAVTSDGFVGNGEPRMALAGCPVDRDHMHRLRALSDAAIVGAVTARQDRPQLAVHDVSGPSPIRVVLGGADAGPPALGAEEDAFVVLRANDGALHAAEIAGRLADHGAHALLVEGGPTTVRDLLIDDGIDWLQVHRVSHSLGDGVPLGMRIAPGRGVASLTWRRSERVGAGRMDHWIRPVTVR